MRVDLAPEVEQLRLIEVGGGPDQLVGQNVDLPDHPVELVRDLADLPVAVQLHLPFQIADGLALHLHDIAAEFPQRRSDLKLLPKPIC